MKKTAEIHLSSCVTEIEGFIDSISASDEVFLKSLTHLPFQTEIKKGIESTIQKPDSANREWIKRLGDQSFALEQFVKFKKRDTNKLKELMPYLESWPPETPEKKTIETLASSLPNECFNEIRGTLEQCLNHFDSLHRQPMLFSLIRWYFIIGIEQGYGWRAIIEAAQKCIQDFLKEESATIDPEFKAVFLEEASDIFEELAPIWTNDESTFFDSDNLATVKRHLHTLKGSGRMVGLTEFGDYVHRIEQLIMESMDSGSRPEGLYPKLCDAYQHMNQFVQALERSDAIPKIGSLLQEAKSVVGQSVNHVSSSDSKPDIDEELLAVFHEEVDELKGTLTQAFETLFKKPTDKSSVRGILRDLHTLKGCARMVGYQSVGDKVHDLEQKIQETQEKPTADDVNQWNEAIQLLLSEMESRGTPPTVIPSTVNVREHAVASLQLVRKIIQSENMEQEEQAALQSSSKIINLPALNALIEKLGTAKNFVQAEGDLYLLENCYQALESGKPLPNVSEFLPKSQQELIAERRLKKPIRIEPELFEQFNEWVMLANIARTQLQEDIDLILDDITGLSDYIHDVRASINALDSQLQERGESNSDIRARFSRVRQTLDSLTKTQHHMRDLVYTAEGFLIEQKEAVGSLQKGLTQAKMVPFSTIYPRLEKIVQQLQSELGKQVTFKTEDTRSELDRQILERLVPTFEHMLRNSLDHGIEDEKIRKKNKKSAIGEINLRVERSGPSILITFKDDGKGIDVQGVRRKAISRGLMAPDAELSDEDILRFILQPGFSTRESVTQISGRGVGMDVVNSDVEKLGGTLSISSELGRSTTFTISIPFTQSLSDVMLFSVYNQWYGIPEHHVHTVIRLGYAQIRRILNGEEALKHESKVYTVRYLENLLKGVPEPPESAQEDTLPILMLNIADTYLGLVVDNLVGTRKIHLRTMGPQLKTLNQFTGASVLADGHIALVLDVIVLQNMILHARQLSSDALSDSRTRVLVVDDSVTIRKIAHTLFNKNGYSVYEAKDGQHAIDNVAEWKPDIILLDIDMPRMNGYEFAKALRRKKAFKSTPIIVISSRNSDEHMKTCSELGVNQVLKKPFQEDTVLGVVKTLLGE